MKIAFLDTSIILRIVLRERDPYRGFENFKRWYASRLLIVESRRVLQRMYLNKDFEEEAYGEKIRELSDLVQRISIISLRERILQRAEDAFPLPVSTLDALHVSSALLLQQSSIDDTLTFITHDDQQAKVGRACGLLVEGVQ